MLEKMYKDEIAIYQYIKYPKGYIQTISYYLNKDNNVKELINNIEKYSQIDIFNEEFRREIIVNNYGKDIVYLNKILSVFKDFIASKNNFLSEKTFEDIQKCCHIFSDNHGLRFLKQLGLSNIVMIAAEIVKKYNNGSYTDEDKVEIEKLQDNLKIFFTNIYHNEELLIENANLTFISIREKSKIQADELKSGFEKIIKTFANAEIELNKYFDIEQIIKEIKGIQTQSTDQDKEKFIDNLETYLRTGNTHTIIKKLLREEDNNNFIYSELDKIILAILGNKK